MTEPQAAAGFNPLHVHLPVFDGPLDLLLHLVRKKELDIRQVRLAELTEPYLDYLKQMRELNLDLAGEFLDIASLLIFIKSKTMLPKPAVEVEEIENQEELLLLRLQEYSRIKDAATELLSLDMLGRDLFTRHPEPDKPEAQPQGEAEFEDVTLFELIEAYRKALERARISKPLELIPDSVTIEDRIDQVLRQFASKSQLVFDDLLPPHFTRTDVVLAFIAVLELVKQKAIRVVQGVLLGQIECLVADDFEQRAEAIRENLMAGIKETSPKPTGDPA